VGMVAGTFIHLLFASGGGGENDEGAVADGVAASMLSFSPTVFFVVLLPPIIFNSGYHVRRDLFFRYLAPICLYAMLGTAVCTFAVAGLLYAASPALGMRQTSFLELLTFGALISASAFVIVPRADDTKWKCRCFR
jgi:NhaP-type Na+/H+ or K+/H+ antiporter